MENSERPEETKEDPNISRLRQLQKMQNSDGSWTEENRQEFLSLQTKFRQKEVISDEVKNALQLRQATAGHDGQPPLTDAERVQIQRINGLL